MRGSVPRQAPGSRQGLSAAAIEHQLQFQQYSCMVCGDGLGREWAVDHDHELAKLHGHSERHGCPRCFRGVLCKGCNLMLGWARDRPEVLERGAAYVRAARERAR